MRLLITSKFLKNVLFIIIRASCVFRNGVWRWVAYGQKHAARKTLKHCPEYNWDWQFIFIYLFISHVLKHKKIKWSRYSPGVALRVGRDIALLFDDCGARSGEWSAARPGHTQPPGKDPVPILQEAGWARGPVWTGGKSRPHRDAIPDRPARSPSLYRLGYSAHTCPQMYLLISRN